MRKTISTVGVLLICMLSVAGGEKESQGARSIGMAGSSVMLTDIWSSFNNQAGLLSVQGLQAGVFYHNKFFVDGLDDQGIAVAYRTGNNVFSVNGSSFGTSVFKDERYGVAYAMSLSEMLDFGVQVNYHNTRILADQYGSKTSFTAEIGLMSQLNEELTLGLHLFNPTQSMLAEYEDERIPTVMRLGGQYTFNEKVSVVSEVAKDMEAETVVRLGAEYRVVPMLWIRAGISNEPSSSSFGAGLELDKFMLDVAASYHNTLGYSSQISLSYSFTE